MNSIKNFQLDKKRSGDIFKRWLKEAGMTYRECEAETGIPYDTLNNTLNGKNELGVERALKLCVVTRHTFAEYMQEMCAGYEHVDFADELQWVVASKTEIIQAEVVESVSNTMAPVPIVAPTVNVTTVETKSDTRLAFSHEFEGCMRLVNEEHERSLERFEVLHADYFGKLESSFHETLHAKDEQIEQMKRDEEKFEESRTEYIESLEKSKKNLRITAIIACVLLCLLVLFVSWELANIENGLTGYLFGLASKRFLLGRVG